MTNDINFSALFEPARDTERAFIQIRRRIAAHARGISQGAMTTAQGRSSGSNLQ